MKIAPLDYEPIAPEDLRQFDEEGYLIVRQALDAATVQRLKDAGDRLVNSDLQTNRQGNVHGRYDGFRNSVTLDEAFVPLIDHPRILPLVVQLLGANLHLMTSHLIYKRPDPQGTSHQQRMPGWHRDYLQAMRDMGHAAIPRIELKCAYYLNDLTAPSSGVTMVAPGSNRLKEPLAIPAGQIDPDGAVEPSIQPGDCLIFENRTWHAGAANLSPNIRKAIMIGYGYRWVMPMDFRRQDPDFIGTLTPLQRYLAGESLNEDQNFHPDGGVNPLWAWAESHGIPTVRHPT